MIREVARTAVLTALVAGIALPVAAQRPGAGNTADRLPPHVQSQLWPERELSPVEQELKDRVIVMRDTLTRVQATIATLQRQERSGATTGVIRSSARALAADCARSRRTAESMAGFAASLSTDDARWGEPAVQAFRSAVRDLIAAMGRCNTALAGHAEAATPDAARVLADASAAGETVRKYDRAELDLLRTLKIRIDPTRSGGSPGR